MIFKWNGVAFDSSEMIEVPEKVGDALGVFISRDYRHVFALYIFPGTGVEAVHVEKETVRRMAELSPNRDLRKAAGLEDMKA